MCRLLVILLVILLPLRGWSAERMSIQMTLNQPAVEAAGMQVLAKGMPADCPMLGQLVSEAEKSFTSSKSHSGCLTCQLCMSLAAQDISSPNLLPYERHVPPLSIAVSFVSAELTRQVKPPIL
jgi:hypothetical protein